jgi:hypothetical protein
MINYIYNIINIQRVTEVSTLILTGNSSRATTFLNIFFCKRSC